MAYGNTESAQNDEKVDVLILGGGSAGFMCAMWLAIYNHYHNANIKYRILERRDGPLKLGQADGVQCRTVEIFQALELEHILVKEAYWVNEVAFWAVQDDSTAANGSADGPHAGANPIQRTGWTADTEPGLSHLPHVILNQARINGMLLEKIRQLDNLEIDYSQEVQDVKVDVLSHNDDSSYPVTVTTKNPETGAVRRIHAKYALGSDGAHSAARHSLGIKMEGDSTNSVWGVMDVYVQTDFPDIRKKTSIRAETGVLMIIPREGGSLVRFYIELAAGTNAKEVKLEDLQATARAIFAPRYSMDFAETIWWSAYSIGQRLADRMHDGTYRVFLAGDACHTHSPKAGQGMNCSLQDGDNFGFKVGSVLAGLSSRELLKTYVTERQAYAAKLIEFDRWWAKMFSTHGETSAEEFRKAFIQSGIFTAGLGAEYEDSISVDRCMSSPSLSNKIKVGMRMPSVQLVRKSDSKPMHLQSLLRADGRWRVVLFGGSVGSEDKLRLVYEIGQYLDSQDGPVRTVTANKRDIDSAIETLVVLSGDRSSFELQQLHSYFSPISGKRKLKDLDKVFFDDDSFNHGHGRAYETLAVDPAVGCIVIVRPDQYVAALLPLEGYSSLSKFFNRIVG